MTNDNPTTKRLYIFAWKKILYIHLDFLKLLKRKKKYESKHGFLPDETKRINFPSSSGQRDACLVPHGILGK